jgi:hypothetical protein
MNPTTDLLSPIRFERPVFVVGPPRSCSTLLFQTLSQSAHLWTIGDESHHLIEQFPQLNPLDKAESNRLTADLLSGNLAQAMKQAISAQLRDRSGGRVLPAGAVRLLEKTPKNSLRIPLLNALFPDALFIHLLRDPKENLSSIMDAWRSRRFVTYPTFGTVNGPWSLLLPPGWRDHVSSPLEVVAVFQWLAAHRHILDDLRELAPERRLTVNATELLQDPRAFVDKLFSFVGLPIDAQFAHYLSRPLPLSDHTLTPPEANKWRRNDAALARVWSRVEDMVFELNEALGAGAPQLDLAPPSASSPAVRPGRNSLCHCGSGLRYKVCHGRLQ